MMQMQFRVIAGAEAALSEVGVELSVDEEGSITSVVGLDARRRKITMKKGFRIITAVLLAVLFSITSLQAAESAAETGLSFEGDSEKFITYEQQSAYENMMPGEKRVQRITLTNNDEEELKFYVRAEYTDPLGEAVADGHVAYNVEFVTNNESFYTGRIGGVTKANMNSFGNQLSVKINKKR